MRPCQRGARHYRRAATPKALPPTLQTNDAGARSGGRIAPSAAKAPRRRRCLLRPPGGPNAAASARPREEFQARRRCDKGALSALGARPPWVSVAQAPLLHRDEARDVMKRVRAPTHICSGLLKGALKAPMAPKACNAILMAQMYKMQATISDAHCR